MLIWLCIGLYVSVYEFGMNYKNVLQDIANINGSSSTEILYQKNHLLRLTFCLVG